MGRHTEGGRVPLLVVGGLEGPMSVSGGPQEKNPERQASRGSRGASARESLECTASTRESSGAVITGRLG